MSAGPTKEATLTETLHLAAAMGNLEEVKKHIFNGANVDRRYVGPPTPFVSRAVRGVLLPVPLRGTFKSGCRW